jgi:hypothetical protein
VYRVPAATDGEYALVVRSVDDAGNAGVETNVTLWVDTLPPSAPPVLSRTPDAVTLTTDAVFEMRGVADGSPGQVSFWYLVTSDGVPQSDDYVPVPDVPLTPTSTVPLSLSRLRTDVSYTIRFVTRDQLQRSSERQTLFSWRVVSAAPVATIVGQPANASALQQPKFRFSARWSGDGGSDDDLRSVSYQVQLPGVAGDLGAWHAPCRFADSAAVCASRCSGQSCEYSVKLPAPGGYTLQVRAVLFNTTGESTIVSWMYVRCADSQFAVLSGAGGDAIECRPCPAGGDCSPPTPTSVVTQADIVAQAGYWASPSSDGSRFYRCPLPDACQRGVNGSRAVCAKGYAHVACSLCASNYFEQFGKCVLCPSSKGRSVGALVGISLLVIAMLAVLYLVRDVLPVNVLKLGVSMVQIIASANSAYDIPWPDVFGSFLSSMRVFLVDVVSMTQANCAQPMDYYASMLIAVVGLKVALVILLFAPWLWSQCQARDCCLTRSVNAQLDRRHLAKIESDMSRDGSRRRSSVVNALQTALALQRQLRSRIAWAQVFKASFTLLFVAYPGVSLKIMRLFKCRKIDDMWWLAADMRLRCYDGRWAGYAVYGVVMSALYVFGLPVAVLWILWRRRHKLYGDTSDPFIASTHASYGFLYLEYGPSAWWWEVEELVRKLLLSAVVVLIDEGSPLQVTLAVLVSGWAHVLHAMYKPWGVGSVLYRLQHGSLFVTSFVFLMGLLFKVQGVRDGGGTYRAMAVVMLMLCISFMAGWAGVVVWRMVAAWRLAASQRVSTKREPVAGTPQLAFSVSNPLQHRVNSAEPSSDASLKADGGAGAGGATRRASDVGRGVVRSVRVAAAMRRTVRRLVPGGDDGGPSATHLSP